MSFTKFLSDSRVAYPYIVLRFGPARYFALQIVLVNGTETELPKLPIVCRVLTIKSYSREVTKTEISYLKKIMMIEHLKYGFDCCLATAPAQCIFYHGSNKFLESTDVPFASDWMNEGEYLRQNVIIQPNGSAKIIKDTKARVLYFEPDALQEARSLSERYGVSEGYSKYTFQELGSITAIKE
jgi:hypothetical protein